MISYPLFYIFIMLFYFVIYSLNSLISPLIVHIKVKMVLLAELSWTRITSYLTASCVNFEQKRLPYGLWGLWNVVQKWTNYGLTRKKAYGKFPVSP